MPTKLDNKTDTNNGSWLPKSRRRFGSVLESDVFILLPQLTDILSDYLHRFCASRQSAAMILSRDVNSSDVWLINSLAKMKPSDLLTTAG